MLLRVAPAVSHTICPRTKPSTPTGVPNSRFTGHQNGYKCVAHRQSEPVSVRTIQKVPIQQHWPYSGLGCYSDSAYKKPARLGSAGWRWQRREMAIDAASDRGASKMMNGTSSERLNKQSSLMQHLTKVLQVHAISASSNQALKSIFPHQHQKRLAPSVFQTVCPVKPSSAVNWIAPIFSESLPDPP